MENDEPNTPQLLIKNKFKQLHLQKIPYTLELESAFTGYNLYIKAQEGEIITKLSIYNYFRFLGKFGVKSFRALQQMIFEKYPTVSDLQKLCADLFRSQIEFNVDFFKRTNDDDDDDRDDES